MHNFYKALLITLLLPLSSIAQVGPGYYSGYAINNKGDTLKGYIEFKNWEYNPRYVSFKSQFDGKPIKLNITDIKFFNVYAGYDLEFRRYEGPITTDNTNANTILYARDTTYRIDTVFLRILRKGNALVLFSYDDDLKTRYFIADGPQAQPVELIYRLYYDGISSNSSGRAVYENTYKRQLFALAEKYNKLDDKLKINLEKSDYNEQDIGPIVSKINGVSDEDNKAGGYTKRSPKIKLLIMVALFIVIAYGVLSVKH